MLQHTPIVTNEEPLRAPIQLPQRDRARRPLRMWRWGMVVVCLGWLLF